MITMSIGDAGQSPLLSAHKSEKHFHSYDPSILRFDLNKIVGLKMRSVTCNRFPIKICDWFLACSTYGVSCLQMMGVKMS